MHAMLFPPLNAMCSIDSMSKGVVASIKFSVQAKPSKMRTPLQCRKYSIPDPFKLAPYRRLSRQIFKYLQSSIH